tara:strand:- start:40 stop:513 length:474 start_codon:yes stop_codon:yes gene_type:complete
MKKLILLLLFITLVFSCTTEEDDVPAQQFLDTYNNVTWIVSQTNDTGYIDNRITFSNNPDGYKYYIAYDGGINGGDLCVDVVFGVTYGDPTEEQIRITIHNESENSITLKQEETDAADAYFSFSVSSDGNSLFFENDHGNGDITQVTYVLYSSSNPC